MEYKPANNDIPRSLEIINELWIILLSRFKIKTSSIESKLKNKLTEEQSGKFIVPEADIILNPTLVFNGMYQIQGRVSSLSIEWTWSFSATSPETIDNCEDLCLGILIEIPSCNISFIHISIDDIIPQQLSSSSSNGLVEVDMIVAGKVECTVDDCFLRGPLGVRICRYLWDMEYLRPFCEHSPLMLASEIYATNPERDEYLYRVTDIARMDDLYWTCNSLSLGAWEATGVRIAECSGKLVLLPSQVSFFNTPVWPILRHDERISRHFEIRLSARDVQVKCGAIRLWIGDDLKKRGYSSFSQGSLGWDTFQLSAQSMEFQYGKIACCIGSPSLSLRRARTKSQLPDLDSTYITFKAANITFPFHVKICSLKVKTKYFPRKDWKFDLKAFRMSTTLVAILSKSHEPFKQPAKEKDFYWMKRIGIPFGTVLPVRISSCTGSKETLPQYHTKYDTNLRIFLNHYLKLLKFHAMSRGIGSDNLISDSASQVVSLNERGWLFRTVVLRVSFIAAASILISPLVSVGKVCLGGLQDAQRKFEDFVRGVIVGIHRWNISVGDHSNAAEQKCMEGSMGQCRRWVKKQKQTKVTNMNATARLSRMNSQEYTMIETLMFQGQRIPSLDKTKEDKADGRCDSLRWQKEKRRPTEGTRADPHMRLCRENDKSQNLSATIVQVSGGVIPFKSERCLNDTDSTDSLSSTIVQVSGGVVPFKSERCLHDTDSTDSLSSASDSSLEQWSATKYIENSTCK
eukprot:CAMPEP_0195290458 /NCGR_PEP_ID=MMETSP0707-20130614/6314_1 /TAXON_ID=33640 /ORGANISM="Asterionellopsis glacialis, Strain CCMP134" /LENGTH=743 /DNA_ID=CAMNT_0040350589 /DNA_START=325 /DNA_END=2556 /DNA_ORIENTATION=+